MISAAPRSSSAAGPDEAAAGPDAVGGVRSTGRCASTWWRTIRARATANSAPTSVPRRPVPKPKAVTTTSAATPQRTHHRARSRRRRRSTASGSLSIRARASSPSRSLARLASAWRWRPVPHSRRAAPAPRVGGRDASAAMASTSRQVVSGSAASCPHTGQTVVSSPSASMSSTPRVKPAAGRSAPANVAGVASTTSTSDRQASSMRRRPPKPVDEAQAPSSPCSKTARTTSRSSGLGWSGATCGGSSAPARRHLPQAEAGEGTAVVDGRAVRIQERRQPGHAVVGRATDQLAGQPEHGRVAGLHDPAREQRLPGAVREQLREPAQSPSNAAASPVGVVTPTSFTTNIEPRR